MNSGTERLALAVDIGGTKFAAAVVSDGGEVLVAVKADVRRFAGQDHQAWLAAIRRPTRLTFASTLASLRQSMIPNE